MNVVDVLAVQLEKYTKSETATKSATKTAHLAKMSRIPAEGARIGGLSINKHKTAMETVHLESKELAETNAVSVLGEEQEGH